MTPDYYLTVGGQDITPAISARLVSLTLKDKRAFEADELTITLDATDGLLAMPPRGDAISVALGFLQTGLVDKGSFVVDEITDTGPPDQLTIQAKSADFHKSLNEQKRRSFAGQPLAEILRTIAGDHGLELVIAEALGWKNPGHIDQTSESDGHLLTRLGRQFDAVATVKAGRLLFSPMGRGTSAGGTPLPGALIARSEGDTHTFSRKEGSTDYTGVKAHWHDVEQGTRKTVTAGGGEDTPKLKTLRETFQNAEAAQAEADSEWQRIKRGRDTMSLSLAIGRLNLIPETPVNLTGWRPEIEAVEWICASVEHTLDGSGLRTSIELENASAA